MTTPTQPPTTKKASGNLVGGAILVLIGILSLASQFIEDERIGLYFVPALALIFLALGLIAREPGLLIPGGILAGVGAGILLVAGNLEAMEEPQKGGAFMLAFAGGWVSILLFSALIRRLMVWPLIPAAIFAGMGGLLLAGDAGISVLELLGKIWPLGLILAGILIFFRKKS